MIFYVPMDEKDVMEIVKSIPKRCNTEMVKYKIRVSVEEGRKTFIVTRHQVEKREGIRATLYSDENFIETRIVMKMADNREATRVGCQLILFTIMFIYVFENVSPLLGITICGIPAMLLCAAMIASSLGEWLNPLPTLVDFLKAQLEQAET